MKVVFDTRPNSGYDDDADRYHFPIRAYLSLAEAAVGDRVLYREPRRDGGREAYVGIATLVSIDPDPASPAHRYARVSDYIPFDRPVPLRGVHGYREALLRDVESPKLIGRTLQGKSVRPISEEDFADIVLEGLGDDPAPGALAAAAHDAADAGVVRRIRQMLVNRKIRDAAFRRRICRAYAQTCAVTGLRVTAPSGAYEVQAAHIWSVADGGPDVIGNGVAMCATAHWLFDQHLIGLDVECRLLIRPAVPDALRRMMPAEGETIRLPGRPDDRPEASFLAKRLVRFRAAAG